RVSSHARTSVRVTLLDVVAEQLRQPAQSGIELRSVTDAARCEMWTSATLPTRRRGDDLYDIACFETLLNETISNADVNARGGGRARYDDRHRSWVTHAEGVHHRADLTTIVKLAAMDIDLDVPDPLHRFLSGRRPPRPDESLDALLELAVLLEQLLDTARQMLWLRLENGSRLVELPLELANELVGERPRDRLDAAHARGRPRLVREAEQGDLARRRHVGPAAQFQRDARNVDHPHDVAVFLREKRHRARGDRLLVLHLARLHREVFPDVRVHLLFDARERGVVDRSVVREVEAQPVGRDHGPLLAHMRTEDLPQARVYEVRRRVVALDVVPPPPLVHLGNRGSRRELVLEMPDDGARAVHLLYVGHLQLPPFPLHPPRIADLPARLGVERVLLQHDLDAVAGLAKLEDICLSPGRLVAHPLLLFLRLNGAPLPGALHNNCGCMSFNRDRSGSGTHDHTSRALALRFQRPLKPRDVHHLAPFRGDQLGQIDREPVGIVQLERVVSRDDLRALQLLQARQPPFDRVEEALFFGARHA